MPNRKYGMLVGANYSNLIESSAQSKNGTTFSVYRLRNLGEQHGWRYGYSYTRQNAALLNKRIRTMTDQWDYNEGQSVKYADIYFDFTVAQFNVFWDYTFFNNSQFCTKLFVGPGFAITWRSSADVQVNSIIKYDGEAPAGSYDYEYIYEHVYFNLPGIGFVYNAGFEIDTGLYLINLIYTLNGITIKHSGQSLSFGEPGLRLHSIALVFGVVI